MAMKLPPHPGLSVRHDCLEPFGLSVTAAAPMLGVSREQMSYIVNRRSGIQAIEAEQDFDGTIHLMLSDVVMPKIGVFETAEIIRESRPDMKIVFMSG